MIYLELFIAFFLANILGYGGGPSVIPLIKYEAVDRYGWMDGSRFAEILALGNTLPGPIATKMAGYIGYEQGGILGATIALIATVLPSLLLMIGLLKLLMKFKSSPRIQNMMLLIQPVIIALLATIAIDFFVDSFEKIGSIHLILISVVSLYVMEKLKLHPFFVIVAALIYGFFVI